MTVTLLWYSEYKYLNHQQHNHVDRIVDIKEPSVRIFVTDISALSVIHRDGNESEKRTVLKRKMSEAVKLFRVDKRLQSHRSEIVKDNHFSVVPLIKTEEYDRPCRNQIRPIAEMRKGDQHAEQDQARRSLNLL